MKIKGLLLSAAVALTMAPPALAERASDGNVSIIYWQAPSILNPYLSGGTKDIESSSLVIEPLGLGVIIRNIITGVRCALEEFTLLLVRYRYRLFHPQAAPCIFCWYLHY